MGVASSGYLVSKSEGSGEMKGFVIAVAALLFLLVIQYDRFENPNPTISLHGLIAGIVTLVIIVGIGLLIGKMSGED
ncbi:MAG: hypothetical protein ACI9OU_001312 [Candidatus Promineifilaceae bacterium]